MPATLREELVLPQVGMCGRVQCRAREAYIGADARHQLAQPAKAHLRADVPAPAQRGKLRYRVSTLIPSDAHHQPALPAKTHFKADASALAQHVLSLCSYLINALRNSQTYVLITSPALHL